ncbi:transcription termination factor mitochondrial [Brachionus plicatilis]|uniref:Transcription termination factor mitochondrial n=1 Tax=Brachionus plicatilis TaxID=10195 RepID=A0A3M7PH42_BRAPC|nr:transcription termination factor mitochondrial [Brachionus plicatilis]
MIRRALRYYSSDYFKKIITYQKPDVSEQSKNFAKKFLQKNNVAVRQKEISVSGPMWKEPHLDEEDELTEEQKMEKQIQNLEPISRPVVYNLAYYVNKSPVLRTFVEMGVFIRKWDQDPSIAKLVLNLDLEKHVKPFLIFLHDIGVPAESHAFIITKNPAVFQDSLQDLVNRVDYLKSKNFDKQAIVRIVMQAPKWLSLSVEEVDARLGWFQKEFGLSGAELRQVVTERPKLVTLPTSIAQKVKFGVTDFLDYSPHSLKSLLIKYPKLFTKKFDQIEANFIFLTQVAKLTHQDIELYPSALVCSLQTLKIRFAFLKSLDRVQFDPTKANFVSLKALCEPDDKVFCTRTAKTSYDEYKKFLKTL